MTPAQIAKSNLFANKSFYGSFTRAGTAANGNVSYSAVGYKPGALVITYGASPGIKQWGTALWGLSLAGTPDPDRGGFCFTSAYYPTDQIALDQTGSWTNVILGSLVSFNSNGFTINWTKIGSPTITLLAYYLVIP